VNLDYNKLITNDGLRIRVGDAINVELSASSYNLVSSAEEFHIKLINKIIPIKAKNSHTKVGSRDAIQGIMAICSVHICPTKGKTADGACVLGGSC
jgi:hypothetical protein